MIRLLISLSLLLIINLSCLAQEQWVLKSEYLSRPDTVLVYRPSGCRPDKKLPLVYLLHGYSENYKQWSKTTNLQKLADQYGMIIITPDAYVSWYLNSTINKKERFEDFFFKDLIPKVNKELKIDEKNIFISGLSMGGYGALRYFFQHEDYFNTAGATSGAFDIGFENLKEVSLIFFDTPRITDDLTLLLGDHQRNNWHQYDISQIFTDSNVKREFIIDCGTEDVLYPVTVALKSLAERMEVPVVFISQPGGHNTEYWNKSIEHHFIFFRQHLK